jgi:DNA sulfur modification protein DndD
MRLDYLVVKDFGPFRGPHTIDITDVGDKSGFAFFGEKNGRGKTTLYNAMKWCLFGEVAERVKTISGERGQGGFRPVVGDDKHLMNNQHLDEDDKQTMSVMLIAEGDKGRIQIMRTAESRTTRPRTDDDLKFDLHVTVGDESFSDRLAQEKIESFFPRELERFFFIDGEALEEYTEMMDHGSVGGLRQEVTSILRLPALTRGGEDFKNIRNSMKGRISSNEKSSQKANSARAQLTTEKRKFDSVEFEKKELRTKMDKHVEERDGIMKQLAQNEELSKYINKMNGLKTQLSEKEFTLKRSQLDLVKGAKDSWKVLLWKKAGPIYEATEEKLNQISSSKSKLEYLSKDLLTRENELAEFKGLCTTCGQNLPNIESFKVNLSETISNLKNEIKTQTNIGNQDENDLKDMESRLRKFKPIEGTKDRVLASNNRWVEDRANIENLIESIKDLDNRVSSTEIEETKELQHRKGVLDTLLDGFDQEFKTLNSKSDLIGLEMKRLQRESQGGNIDHAELKIENILGKLINTVRNAVTQYTESARARVEIEASKVFMEVTNSPEVFSGIDLDNNFRARIKLRQGGFATGPSSGMTSMMTMSIIDGLRTVSGLNAPTFFDTPGRSLDDEHKKLMLEYFWRDHGKQFFIFAHSGEYKIKETIEEYGDRIARAWSLTFPSDHKECPKCDSEDRIQTTSPADWKCLKCNHEFNTSGNYTIVKQLELSV